MIIWWIIEENGLGVGCIFFPELKLLPLYEQTVQLIKVKLAIMCEDNMAVMNLDESRTQISVTTPELLTS